MTDERLAEIGHLLENSHGIQRQHREVAHELYAALLVQRRAFSLAMSVVAKHIDDDEYDEEIDSAGSVQQEVRDLTPLPPPPATPTMPSSSPFDVDLGAFDDD